MVNEKGFWVSGRSGSLGAASIRGLEVFVLVWIQCPKGMKKLHWDF